MPELPWLAHLDEDDQAAFFGELGHAALSSFAVADPGPLEDCLRAWRVTAEALSDPQARAVLTGPLEPGDFCAAQRPEACG